MQIDNWRFRHASTFIRIARKLKLRPTPLEYLYVLYFYIHYSVMNFCWGLLILNYPVQWYSPFVIDKSTITRIRIL